MDTRKTNILLIVLSAIIIFIGFIFYAYLPAQIAVHWNIYGQADSYVGKLYGLCIFPFMMTALFILYFFIPKVDPLKLNIESFRRAYNSMWIFIFLFLAYIFGLMLVWNLGYYFNLTLFIVPAISVSWYVLGALLQKMKRNWFVGIRTPWTLSSDVVWDETHKLGGNLFKLSALISLLGLFFRNGNAVFILTIVPVIVVTLITVVYSYVLYRRENI